jgi:hypothetical protein
MAAARVFISYAHQDESFRDELVKHLRLLEREQLIEVWHDRKIVPGQDWSRAIHDNLASAGIFILLISVDFIDSDYCYGLEMEAALRAAERGDAQVVPVLVRHTAFEAAPFAKLQMLPRNCIPVADFAPHDKAWIEIASAIRGLIIDQHRPASARAEAGERSSDAPPIDDWNRLREALLARLQLLDRSDDWVDHRFTDLAAEVEADTPLSGSRWRRWFGARGRQLRRVPSLHSAIVSTTERLSLIVGDPGSGKSVAMRHLARQMLQKAGSADYAVLPIYVNLREMTGFAGEVTSQTIKASITGAICRDLEPTAAAFFERCFIWALRSGLLLILLDSFDEIPEVLGSGEPDATVTKYAEAIHSFANGMHDSRIVVSSRPYRGPGRMRWPQFRILPLSEDRRRAFIHAWFNDDAAARAVLGELLRADSLDEWIDNPLLLALLCAHRKALGALPESAHEAFESFVTRRIASRPDLLQRHRLSAPELRTATEQIAFTMNADHAVGLAPKVGDLQESMRRRGLADMVAIESVVACLVDLHLGRASLHRAPWPRVFSFSHRRVQEYFCTCFALRSPQQLDIDELLTNERWRETAVTLLQTADREHVGPILRAAHARLTEHDAEIQRSLRLPLRDLHAASPRPSAIQKLRALHGPRSFPWPPGLIHLLGILSDYRVFRGAPELEAVRRAADPCVLAPLSLGSRIDQATALQVSSAMSAAGRRCALSWAFTSDSLWLEDIAFERSRHLAQLPSVMVARIGSMLVLKQLTGELRRERTRIEAQIRRLDAQSGLLDGFHALRRLVAIDVITIGFISGSLVVGSYSAGLSSMLWIAAGAALSGFVAYACGSAGVRRRALRQWRDETPDRVQLAANALFAFGATVTRATVLLPVLLGLAVTLELPFAAMAGSGVLVALLLGHRPGVYCAAGRTLSRRGELFAGLQPVVLVAKGAQSRLGAALLIASIGSGVPLLAMYSARVFDGIQTSNSVAEPMMLVGVAAIYGAGLIGLLVFVYRRVSDRLRLRRCRRRSDLRSAVEVLGEAGKFRRDETRTRYFQWVREHQVIAATVPNERILTELLSILEHGNDPSPSAATSEVRTVAVADDFQTWFAAYANGERRRLERWRRSVDELAQLVDQLRAKLGK